MGAPNLVREFSDGATMAETASAELGASLARTIAQRGSAAFAAAGGQTPIPTYRHLCHAEIAWHKVFVTLTDERCVPPDSAMSNERMLRSELLQAGAAEANFVSPSQLAYGAAASPGFAAMFSRPLPLIDIVLLGMGEDGHVASLFPGSSLLVDPLPKPDWIMVRKEPGSAGWLHDRISLTFEAIAAAPALYLIASGPRKRELIDQAFAATSATALPVHAVFRRRPDTIVFWSP
jgi:6-phosphogluconolactonase